MRRFDDPANWRPDRFGRPSIELDYHRVTLHRVGDRWSWSYERFDEPGYVRMGAVAGDMRAARFHVTFEFGQDFGGGGMEREMIFRGFAATDARRRARALAGGRAGPLTAGFVGSVKNLRWVRSKSPGCAAPPTTLNGNCAILPLVLTFPSRSALPGAP